jgi:hypothetical protein
MAATTQMYSSTGNQRSSTVRSEFIDENGGGPGVRLRKRHQKKS